MDSLLIKNGTVVTLGASNRIIADGAVYIEDHIIRDIGREATVRKKNSKPQKVLDAHGGIIMPGFICPHMHFYSTFARGLSPKQPPPANFVEILERMWFPLDKALREEDLYYSALVPMIEGIRNGTTFFIDHHESQGFQKGSLACIERAARKTGVRVNLTLGISDRYGKGAEGLEENLAFIPRIQRKNQRGDWLVTAMMGLHALFTVKPKTLQAAVDAARDLDCGLHVHMAEDRADQDYNKKKYGMPVVKRLAKAGGLTSRTLAIHCVHVGKSGQRLLAEADACVVHNPQSNMNNAVGVAPVMDFLDRGILTGLGTDAMTTNMRDEVRAAHLLQKLNKRDPRVFFAESCQLLLQNNPLIAQRFLPRIVGELRKGALADVITVDYDPATPMNRSNFLGHFLFGLCGASVRSTVINGKVRMKDRVITGLNEARILASSRKLAQAFWKRF
jgi:putative selenium metabolism protein SsnA